MLFRRQKGYNSLGQHLFYEQSLSTYTSNYDTRTDPDMLTCWIRDQANPGSSLAQWFIYNPGADNVWSGGNLKVALVNNTDFLVGSGEYANEDALVFEYSMFEGITFSGIVDDLSLVRTFYGVQISNLQVMTHGLVNGSVGEGVELGDLVFYSNYTNYQSQFMALNDLMVDNGQIVFYSCSLGDQPAMLNQIAAWTNTDIFACADNVSIQYYVPLGWTWNHDYWCWHPTYADWSYKSDATSTRQDIFTFYSTP